MSHSNSFVASTRDAPKVIYLFPLQLLTQGAHQYRRMEQVFSYKALFFNFITEAMALPAISNQTERSFSHIAVPTDETIMTLLRFTVWSP